MIKLKNKSLPGIKSQLELAPPNRLKLIKNSKGYKKKDAAVSLCFFQDSDQNIKIPLILRNTYDGVHSNQISFPGGKKDKCDDNLIQTAKRETAEEIGLNQNEMKFQFKLTNIYIPPSNFLVRPYIFTINSTPKIIPNPKEVVKVLSPKVADILNLKIRNSSNKKPINNYPYFIIEDHIVWGATAMILNEFRALLK